MAGNYQDTLRFSVRPGFDQDDVRGLLSSIRELKGVFDVVACPVHADFYDVKLDGSEDHCAVGHRIAQHPMVHSTIITPKKWYETQAKAKLEL